MIMTEKTKRYYYITGIIWLPVIVERVEICSALAGEEGEVLYKMHLEQKCSE